MNRVYAEGLDERLVALSQRLRRNAYRPLPARRSYIEKDNGSKRPLGIPSFEDRLVQDRLSRVLQAIWEPEFKEFSFGFRPGRGAHDALYWLAQVIRRRHTQWVVEADIKGFFDHLGHTHLMDFLRRRIADPNVLRLIERFLKAGVMEDGAVEAGREGAPQGALVSPVLANIYLHYVLDTWFTDEFAPRCGGSASLIRYADDFVGCFARREDAEAFYEALAERLRAFDLELAAEKTAILRFGSTAADHCREDGLAKPRTFDFLGFTHYVTFGRNGGFYVGRRTIGKRVRKKLRALGDELAKRNTAGGTAMIDYAGRHLRGHIQYYGVSGNFRSVRVYIYQGAKALYRALVRRSQRRRLTWARFWERIAPQLPRARIVHNFFVPPAVWLTRTGSRMV
jgi:group II intron reverse transcriptase/maturase